MSTSQPSVVPNTRPRHERRPRIMTVVTAVAVGLIGWTVAGPLLGVPLRVRVTPTAPAIEVTVLAVALASLLAGLAGLGVLTLLARSRTDVRRAWTVVAAVVLLLSFAGPAGGVQLSTVVALGCLHLLVGGVLLVGFRRSVTVTGGASESR